MLVAWLTGLLMHLVFYLLPAFDLPLESLLLTGLLKVLVFLLLMV
jgi:hypothetical protein